MSKLACATAVIAIFTVPAFAATNVEMMRQMPSNSLTVTDWYKQDVYDPNNNKIGEVMDVLVDKSGKVTSLIVGIGGFLGAGEKDVAVPFDAVKVTNKNNSKWRLVMSTTKDDLKNAPGFKYDRSTTTWVPEEQNSLRLHDQGKSIASVVEFLAGTMGIEIHESPPKPLSNLARLARGNRSWILDVDVDYMYEMQKECYTQIGGTEPGVLQSMSKVVRFIQESRPGTITLSEARVSAIRDRESNFSKLIAKLSAMGYEIEENGVFESDAEVLRGIAVCREFYRTISRELVVQHMPAMMRGDLKEFKEEEEAAAWKFFKSKGCAV